MAIDSQLVRNLLGEQFPQWADLEVRPIQPGGWDNRSFRIGVELVARLPSAEEYALQAEKEQRWLPRLAPQLPVAVPVPVALGQPGIGYPWRWSIHRWIDGAMPPPTAAIAKDLAGFLSALRRIDPGHGPGPGAHNFHRGGGLEVYDAEFARALEVLQDAVDHRAARDLWQKAVATRWKDAPVWLHGDVSPGNLLARRGRLVAVIDFGNAGVGDPACDLSIAWTWFEGDARAAFLSQAPCDEWTWLRARAWGLWKALIVAAGMSRTNAVEYASPQRVIHECLSGD